MSHTELLPAIRSLPRSEQVQLMHVLVDELTRPDLPPEDVLQRALAIDFAHNPPPEFVTEMWRMIEESKKQKLATP